MSEIAPSITVQTADEFKALVELLHPFAHRVHIDLSDGEFAPTFLLPDAQLWWPQEWVVDVHAMVARPAEHVAALIALKPNLITFHVEAGGNDLLPIMAQIKQAGIKAGIALLKPTVPTTVTDLIQAADHIMVFSGELGQYGGTASLMQLEKVRLIKMINSSAEIGWDGGVNVENAYTLTQGGVNVLNTGSAISLSDNPPNAYASLVKEINKHGVI